MKLSKAAHAKINLGLHVLRRRVDGYHDLETVFLRIPWADTVEVSTGAALRMTCSDPHLPTDEGNLCMRAALRLADWLGERRGASIHLDKGVPYGSGLGGGSSDAAATLDLLVRLWAVDISPEALRRLAAEIGSDVPFFLGEPAAHATGRGEVLTSLRNPESGDLYTLPYALVVVVPPVEISTQKAYSMVSPREAGRPDLRALILSNDLDQWRAKLVNDFEAPIFEAFPAVRAARQMLEDAGASYASLSGSGSAVFGVFEEPNRASAAAEAARFAGLKVWSGTLASDF